jgi:hypothetical protein
MKEDQLFKESIENDCVFTSGILTELTIQSSPGPSGGLEYKTSDIVVSITICSTVGDI